MVKILSVKYKRRESIIDYQNISKREDIIRLEPILTPDWLTYANH